VLWALILDTQAAAWTLTVRYVWGTVSRRVDELRAERALRAATLVCLGLALAMLVLLPVAELSVFDGRFLGIFPISLEHLPRPNEFPLAHYKLKIRVIQALGAIVALLAIAGTLLTALAFNRLQPASPPHRWELERFLALRKDLGALLDVAAILIGLATLATGVLRVAVLATNREPYFTTHPGRTFEFAPGYVLAYGLFFTALLAFAFAPGFLTMRAAAARLRERAHPLPAPAAPEFAEVVTRRKALDEVLQTNLWASATLKGVAAVLTPLASSLVALLLPTG
jgi:hypothetical protein